MSKLDLNNHPIIFKLHICVFLFLKLADQRAWPDIWIYIYEDHLLGLLPLLGSFLATFLLPQVIVTGLYAEINHTKAFILENIDVTNILSIINIYTQRPLKRTRHIFTFSIKIMLILALFDPNDPQELVPRKTPQTNKPIKIFYHL